MVWFVLWLESVCQQCMHTLKSGCTVVFSMSTVSVRDRLRSVLNQNSEMEKHRWYFQHLLHLNGTLKIIPPLAGTLNVSRLVKIILRLPFQSFNFTPHFAPARSLLQWRSRSRIIFLLCRKINLGKVWTDQKGQF
jgi:hypothetical protein